MAGTLAEGTAPPVRYGKLAQRVPDGDLNLPDLFPEEAGGGPLELDVGFGRGASLFSRAEAAPESRIIGIEIKSKWAFKVEERLRKYGLDRARAFAGDAREILHRSGPDGCLDVVFLHFPDPWWKRRHDKRRVLNDAFTDDIVRLLRPGGVFYVQTDVEDRGAMFRDLLRDHGAFDLEGEDGFVADNPYGARSNREIRAEEDGLPVFRIVARRR